MRIEQCVYRKFSTWNKQTKNIQFHDYQNQRTEREKETKEIKIRLYLDCVL